MGCPTGTIIQITTESGMDERKTGPVESTASAFAVASGAMTTLPFIGQYARASQKVFSSIERWASLFGFSYPTDNNYPSRVKNEPFQNEANTIGMDTGKRITLDPMQELTVDPRIVGSNEDETTIGYLCSVPTLLDTFQWRAADIPNESLLFSTIVVPNMNKPFTNMAGTYVQPTSMGFATRPFQFWRGDITIRCEVIASKFHKGKMVVWFEPNVAQAAINTALYQPNKKYSLIVDIEETQDFEICINWANAKPWAQMPTPLQGENATGQITDLVSYFELANGFLGIMPITPMVSPDDSTIQINVYAFSTNMVVNQATQNFPLDISEESGTDPTSNSATCFGLNPTGASMTHITEQYFGELPASFHALLKRFWTTQIMTASQVNPQAGQASFNIIPVVTPTPVVDTTYIASNLFNYLRLAYLGMRGGMRKRFRALGIPNDICGHIKIHLDTPLTSEGVDSFNFVSFTETSERFDGTVTFVPHTNGGVEYEIPFYSNNLFALSQSTDPFPTGVDYTVNNYVSRKYDVVFDCKNTAATLSVTIVEETATGEDFMFLRYVAPVPYSHV